MLNDKLTIEIVAVYKKANLSTESFSLNNRKAYLLDVSHFLGGLDFQYCEA